MALEFYNHNILVTSIIALDLLFLLSVGSILLGTFRTSFSKLAMLQLAILMVVGFTAFYRSPYQASDLIVSDSVEYVGAAKMLLDHNLYGLEIDGRILPPRYPPAFSTLFVLPAYTLLGPEVGNGVYTILLFGLIGLVSAFLIGEKVAPGKGGSLAGLLLILIPEYRHYSWLIMSDIPGTAISLLVALQFTHMRINSRAESLSNFLATGILIGFACLLRISHIFLILPFIVWMTLASHKRSLKKLSALCLPVVLALCSLGAYNNIIFGSFLRSGYNFWAAVPYDYLSLTFSLRYILANIGLLVTESSLVPLVLVLLFGFISYNSQRNSDQALLSQRHPYNALLHFFFVYSLASICFYLPYFYCSPRLILPATSLCAILVAGILSNRLKSTYLNVLLSISAAVGSLIFLFKSPPLPERRIAVEAIAASPPNSLIIGGLDPIYVEMFDVINNGKQYLPISRQVEFASKLLTPHKIEPLLPFPTSPVEHRASGLISGGAIEAVKKVALEDFDMIQEGLNQGRPTFLETSVLKEADITRLGERFTLTPIGQRMTQVGTKPTN